MSTPPPTLTELALTAEMKEAVDGAFAMRRPMVVAYVDELGAPQISYRGSTQSYSDTELAIWVRNPTGRILESIAANPAVALLYGYFEPNERGFMIFRGRARVDGSDAVRERVYGRSLRAVSSSFRKRGPVRNSGLRRLFRDPDGASSIRYRGVGSALSGVAHASTCDVRAFRLPPTADADKAAASVKEILEANPPPFSTVSFHVESSMAGWNAPPVAEWLESSMERASQDYFAKPSVYMGTGGTIPFMGMLGEKFPQAQFLVTGLLGPSSNAHGPNEFLHIAKGKKLTCCVAQVLEDHFKR